MNLFAKLGIYHSVIFDKDQDIDIHSLINTFIDSNKNTFSKGIYSFNSDFEDFLSIPKPVTNRNDLKPLNIMDNTQTTKLTKEYSRIKKNHTVIVVEIRVLAAPPPRPFQEKKLLSGGARK